MQPLNQCTASSHVVLGRASAAALSVALDMKFKALVCCYALRCTTWHDKCNRTAAIALPALLRCQLKCNAVGEHGQTGIERICQPPSHALPASLRLKGDHSRHSICVTKAVLVMAVIRHTRPAVGIRRAVCERMKVTPVNRHADRLIETSLSKLAF